MYFLFQTASGLRVCYLRLCLCLTMSKDRYNIKFTINNSGIDVQKICSQGKTEKSKLNETPLKSQKGEIPVQLFFFKVAKK